MMLVTFGICFKHHFETRYLVLCSISPPRMFLPLGLLSEYRIQHGAIGPLYVTYSYSTWIFCRGVSGFATDCPSGVWCRGLTTCLLHVGSPFGNRLLNNSWAVGLTSWIVYLHFFYICKYICIDTPYHFSALYLLLKYCSYFFKYSCTNIFNRRSIYTFYWCTTKSKSLRWTKHASSHGTYLRLLLIYKNSSSNALVIMEYIY